MKNKILLLLTLGVLTLAACKQKPFDGKAAFNIEKLSVEEGLKQARKESKLLYVYMYTDWCGYCRKMTQTTFQDSTFGGFMNKNFVNIYINAEKDDVAFAKENDVRVFPTHLIFTASGERIGKIEGYLTASEMENSMRNILKRNAD